MLERGRKRRMLQLVYIFVLLLGAGIIYRLTWPRLEALFPISDEAVSNSNGNANNDPVANVRDPGITMGGTYIYAAPNRIIIWTTIKLTDKSGKVTYLKNLNKSSFSILESYLGNTYQAPVLEVSSDNVPVRAILVIDKSGSMNEPSGVNNSAKIDVIRNAAIFFVDQLLQSSTNYIAVLPFSGEGVGDRDFIRSQSGDIWSSQADKEYLKQTIKRSRAGGQTPLWQAISTALDQLSKIKDESYKVIICLSDGMSNRGSKNFDSLLETVKEKQIPIFTIGYGKESQLNDQELIQLSDESGAGKKLVGSFLQIPPKEWSAQLQNIGTDFTNLYKLYWEPTGAMPKTQVNVEIKVAYEVSGQYFESRERRSYVMPESPP